eukprot:622615-Prymnesium_polylepis.1
MEELMILAGAPDDELSLPPLSSGHGAAPSPVPLSLQPRPQTLSTGLFSPRAPGGLGWTLTLDPHPGPAP